MSRGQIAGALLVLTAGFVFGQDAGKSVLPPGPADAASAEMPPEEDKTNEPKEYSFNPVQSAREVTAGNFYFKKGNFTAAASRFLEATRWNEGNVEAWMRLGETQEKKANAKAAREAYLKYLELAPDAKNAAEIKKRLAKLKS